MKIPEVTVRSLGELIDRVTPSAPDPATGRRRDAGVYRGSPHAAWPLLTSLDRLGGGEPHAKAELEPHILRNFARYSRPHLPAGAASDWELLVTAQHHGLPTRLLDWSYSPLVAAHFATCRATRGEDCVIWRLDWQRVHRAFGFPPLALSLADLERILGEGDAPLTPWALFEGKRREPFACMIDPPSLDRRIMVQSATFTVCSETRTSFECFLERHGLLDALTRFVLPADAVPYVRDQLDLVGMDERRLFPDLDGVAAELRRYYS
jgi:hypothetical protein